MKADLALSTGDLVKIVAAFIEADFERIFWSVDSVRAYT